jgi:hypothetical protein
VNLFDARVPANIWNLIIPEPNSGCWFWLGGTTGRTDYGRVRLRGGGKHLAHRVVFTLLGGSLTAALELDHKCRNTRCVNPSHLEAVTHQVNVLRGTGLAAQRARQRFCKHGHELAGDNVEYYERRPGRQMRRCRACRVGADRRPS